MNQCLKNKVILVVAGEEDRDAAIIQLLEAEGAIPCFVFANEEDGVAMVREMIRRHGCIDGIVSTLPANSEIIKTALSSVCPKSAAIMHLTESLSAASYQEIAQKLICLLTNQEPILQKGST